MKIIKNIAVISVFALVGFSATLDAQPLIFTESTHHELRKANENKDAPALYLKYATIESDKFCVASGAHLRNEWLICKTGVESQILARTMTMLADREAEAQYDISRQQTGRY